MKKYIAFAIFFIAMTLASDFAFSLPHLYRQFGGADAYIYFVAKVTSIVVAIVIGYFKLSANNKSKDN